MKLHRHIKFWILILLFALGLAAVEQGCGSNASVNHTVYGTTS